MNARRVPYSPNTARIMYIDKEHNEPRNEMEYNREITCPLELLRPPRPECL